MTVRLISILILLPVPVVGFEFSLQLGVGDFVTGVVSSGARIGLDDFDFVAESSVIYFPKTFGIDGWDFADIPLSVDAKPSLPAQWRGVCRPGTTWAVGDIMIADNLGVVSLVIYDASDQAIAEKTYFSDGSEMVMFPLGSDHFTVTASVPEPSTLLAVTMVFLLLFLKCRALRHFFI